MKKLKLATVWLDGCSGCHMSLLDLDGALIPIVRKVDIVYGPLVDAQEFPEDVDVTLVEGAVSTQEDVEQLQKIRQRTKMLVSLGDCAVTGNVAAMRNTIPVNKLLQQHLRGRRRRQQVHSATTDCRNCPKLARPAQDFVKVDVCLPGCPPQTQGDCRLSEQPAGRPQAGHDQKIKFG